MNIHIAHAKCYLCVLLAKTSSSHPQQHGTQDKLQNSPKAQNKPVPIIELSHC